MKMNNIKVRVYPSLEMMRKFVDLLIESSPENITCDGERPEKEVIKAYAIIQAKWQELETELGRTVSDDEVWTDFEREIREIDQGERK